MLLYLHHRNSKLFFHPAKFDNFQDEKISDYKTVSVPQSRILAGLKTLGLVGLLATFEGSSFMFWGAKKFLKFFKKYFSIEKLHKMAFIIFLFLFLKKLKK